jgi:DNA-binding GntR family transcriptional regulator
MTSASTWGLSAVERRSTTEQVLVELRAAIVLGRIGPREPLREAALATALGTGRSSVREAIRHLVQEGPGGVPAEPGRVCARTDRGRQ